MKNVLNTLVFCLIAVSGFSQAAKYSFEEVSYSPAEMTKAVTVYSTDIVAATGNPKYKVTASIDIKNKKLASNYVYLSGEGIQGQSCQIQITHVGHLYLGGGVNTGGVEAYACRFFSTTVVFYFLAGATTDNTLKFLFYVPSGPTGLQAAN